MSTPQQRIAARMRETREQMTSPSCKRIETGYQVNRVAA
jgi:hypothetical protein